MIEIMFEINGRPVSPDKLGDAIKTAALEALRAELLAKLRGVQCPEHKVPPTITVKSSSSLEQMEFSVSGCCEKVIDVAHKALGDHLSR